MLEEQSADDRNAREARDRQLRHRVDLHRDVRPPHERRHAEAEEHQREPARDLVGPQRHHHERVHEARGAAGQRRRRDAQPRILRVRGRDESRAGAREDRALDPEVHDARPFGDHLAQGRVEDRRAGADAAADDCVEQAEHQAVARRRKRLPSTMKKISDVMMFTVAYGSPRLIWIESPPTDRTPSRIAITTIPSG